MSYMPGGYTREEVLDKLIAAGLGDTEQHHITQDEYRRAMAGEIVIAPRVKAPSKGVTEICPRCKGEKQNRSWSYCRACNAAIKKLRPSRWMKRQKRAFVLGPYHPDSIR